MIDSDVRANAPRFRCLDRWLEPRWRALLMWVVLAAVTGALLDRLGDGIFEALNDFLGEHVFAFLPFSVPASVSSKAVFPSLMFLLYWFQPLSLRLNWARIVIWLMAGPVLGVIILALGQVGGLWGLRVSISLVFGSLAGIPGLAVTGQRTRPWMSLVGGALSMAYVFSFNPQAHGDLVFLLGGSNLIYGAVMLYGTDPLPRRPAESQLGEDQR